MATWTEPERIELARLSTPIQRLERTSDALGVEVWVKRDDLTGAELSGNKVRKLEYLFADARAQGADTVITCGGQQSNHCRATAMAAARLGMSSHLLLRTSDPQSPPVTEGNILLDKLAGASIQWISHAQYQRRSQLMSEAADELRKAGRTPYVIPEGGSNAVGAWGYVRCAEELDVQLAELGDEPTTVVYACGSGGTGAGLVLGAAMLGWANRGIRVAGINVCDDRDYFVRVIGDICRDVSQRYAGNLGDAAGAAKAITDESIDIVDGFVGLGYAKSRPEELAVQVELCRREGLVVDPVYTGKAFYGLTRTLATDPGRLTKRIVFLHTGGIYGVFPAADQLAEHLR